MIVSGSYGCESLIDEAFLNEAQLEFVDQESMNRACDPCDCDVGDSGCCRCN
jgi:hypothetical protein